MSEHGHQTAPVNQLHWQRMRYLALGLLLCAGCGDDTAVQETAPPPDDEPRTFAASIVKQDVPPGEEYTQCITRRLDDLTEDTWISQIKGTLSPGSHHMIVYASFATQEVLEPMPCMGFSGLFMGDVPLFIVQQRQTELTLPVDDGRQVAFMLNAEQMVRIEMHFINTTSETIDIDGAVEFIPTEEPDPIRADFAFWGTTQLHQGDSFIPPMTAGDTGLLFQAGTPGTKSFAATTHQHQLGTRMRLWYAEGPDDSSAPVVDNTDWSDPPLQIFDPPLVWDGTTGFAYRCEYDNPSEFAVSFGEGYYDEMCFLWHYYYPGNGPDICTDLFCF